MLLALDTNILVYAEGVNDADKRDQILNLLERLPGESIVLPVQALGELFHVLVRKAKWSPASAREVVLGWRDAYRTIDTSFEVLAGATQLAQDHQFAIWDGVILSAAAEAGSRLLLSEDLQAGFTWRGVTIVNPFTQPRAELLAAFLATE